MHTGEYAVVFQLTEANHVGASTSTHVDNKILYTEGDRPRVHGG